MSSPKAFDPAAESRPLPDEASATGAAQASPTVAGSDAGDAELTRAVLHRFKNSMAVISSLIGLRMEGCGDPAVVEALGAIRGRVRTIGLAHEQQRPDGGSGQIALAEYLAEIVRAARLDLAQRAPRARVQTRLADVYLDIRRAIPCGLIVYELVANSLRHAFPDGREGRITVVLEGEGDHTLRLVVADDGVGIGDGEGPPSPQMGRGLHLVELLSQQLGGTAELSWRDGVEARVDLPRRRG